MAVDSEWWHILSKHLDLTGRKFGKWYVLGHMCTEPYRCLVTCECGTVKTVLKSHLTGGHTTMCMSCRSSKPRNVNTHYMSKTRTYKTWDSMKCRCSTTTDEHYKNYGARGITVCDEWKHSFNAFLSDMGERPNGMTLDRIDNDGDYCKENCRWATNTEQCNNKSNNVRYMYNGEELTVRSISDISGMKLVTLRGRLGRGWSVEKSLIEPIDTAKGHGRGGRRKCS